MQPSGKLSASSEHTEDYPYKISVVMPIYNSEQYLCEAIESVLFQTIGIDNIQLLLIDDGSTDNSGMICKEYANCFPNNVFYIHKENGGVSSACNKGLDLAQGEYVNFFGSDDIWEPESFELACNYMDELQDCADVAVCRVVHIGAKEGVVHPLDYRFENYDSNSLIDLEQDPNNPQMMLGNCIIRASAIGNRRLNINSSYAEDAEFICPIILRTLVYAIVPSAVYEYRKYEESVALSSKAMESKARYLECPLTFIMPLIHESLRLYGIVPKWAQYTVMYETQWIVKRKVPATMTPEDISLYRDYLVEILQYIDASVICSMRNLPWAYHLFLIRLKTGEEQYKKGLHATEYKLWHLGDILANGEHNKMLLQIKLMEVNSGVLKLEGICNIGVFDSDAKLRVIVSSSTSENGSEGGCVSIMPEFDESEPYVLECFMGSLTGTGQHFVANIPISSGSVVRFEFVSPNFGTCKVKPAWSVLAKLSERWSKSYYSKDGHLLILQAESRYINRDYYSR